MSRDSIGYVDGVNLYAAYFVPHGMDPYGYMDYMIEVGINQDRERQELREKRLAALCSNECLAFTNNKCTKAECLAEVERILSVYLEMFDEQKIWWRCWGDYNTGWMCYQWQTHTYNALMDIDDLKCFDIERVGFLNYQKEEPLRHNWVAVSTDQRCNKEKSVPSGPCTAYLDPWKKSAPDVFPSAGNLHRSHNCWLIPGNMLGPPGKPSGGAYRHCFGKPGGFEFNWTWD